jgi:hypothetical protein
MWITSVVARQRLGNSFFAVINIQETVEELFLRVVFCTVRVVSKDSMWVCLSPILVYVPPKRLASNRADVKKTSWMYTSTPQYVFVV